MNIRDDINVLFVEGKNNLILLLWNVNKYLLIVNFGNLKIKKIKKYESVYWKIINSNWIKSKIMFLKMKIYIIKILLLDWCFVYS